MNLGELRAKFRRDTKDEKPKYFWSDQEVDFNINEALFEAVDRGLMIYDRDSFTLDIDVGETDYPLDPSIIRVKSAVVTAKDGVTLDRPEPLRLSDRRADYSYQQYFDLQGYRIEEDGQFTLATVPTGTFSVALVVWRYANPLVSDTDEPEIPERYHAKMLNWALKLAYLKQDADTFDQARADAYDNEFTRTFGPPKTAQQHRQRRRLAARSLKTPF